MTKFYDDLMESLDEAIAIEKGSVKAAKRTKYSFEPVTQFAPASIRKIRTDSGMTQAVFAAFMGVSNKTVEAWEKGRNHPTGPACRLISILQAQRISVLPYVAQ